MHAQIAYDLSRIDYLDFFPCDETKIAKLKDAILGQLAMKSALSILRILIMRLNRSYDKKQANL